MIPETIERIRDSERAVSPVIGVILMVAITVILAAVIAAFVLGFGADQDSAPQATWGVDEPGDGSVEFVHEGGDSVPAENLIILVDGNNETAAGETTQGDLSAGSTFASNATLSSGDTVRLVWQAPGSDETSTLRTYEVEG